MKAILTFMTGLSAAWLAAAPQAGAADDYWSPENMAKRECTSVHLNYGPAVDNTAAYQVVTVEKSAPGTYFACNNFSCGYIGIQELPSRYKDGRPVRVAIFSVWDAKASGDNPHAAAEEDRAKLVQRGPEVETTRFGGEGTGGKSMRLFDWKEGEPVRTLVVEKEDGPDFRQLAGYIFNPATKKWELMSCWRIQALKRGLGAGCGFVEDFMRNVKSKENERRATFGPALRWTGKDWSPATEFRASKDGNPNTNINYRFNPQLGYFSAATGGAIAEEADFKAGQTKVLPVAPKYTKPGKAVMDIINAPLLETKSYGDYKNPRWNDVVRG